MGTIHINNLKIFYDKSYKYHVVSIINDGKRKLIVFRYYGKHKQWWHYEIMELWHIENMFEAGLWKLKRNK